MAILPPPASEAVPFGLQVLVTVSHLPITHDLKPDLSYVEKAGRDVFSNLKKGLRRRLLF